MMKSGTREEFSNRIDIQLSRYEEQFGVIKSNDDPGARLQNLIEKTPVLTGQKAVVIIDEYDAPLLTVLHDPEQLVEMRQTVRAFLSCLKDCDPYLRFVFITGITKFSQVSSHTPTRTHGWTFSELNNLDKITMLPQYSTLCGITQEELETQMMPWVERLAHDNERHLGRPLPDDALRSLLAPGALRRDGGAHGQRSHRHSDADRDRPLCDGTENRPPRRRRTKDSTCGSTRQKLRPLPQPPFPHKHTLLRILMQND